MRRLAFRGVMLACLAVPQFLSAQSQSGCSAPVQIHDSFGVPLNEGTWLKDNLFSTEDIRSTTLRYGPDVETISKNGDSLLLDRKMDIYYPDPQLNVLATSGDTIREYPVIFIAPPFSGLRENSANRARLFAMKGYVTVVFSYRSDFSGYSQPFGMGYCLDVDVVTYLGAQDLRAAVRAFTTAVTDFKTLSPEELLVKFGDVPEDCPPELKLLPANLTAYFFVGYSFGSTVVLNALLRNTEADWPQYLYTDNTLDITGIAGDKLYGNYGSLDDVGMPWMQNTTFPWHCVKGILCHNASTFSLDGIDFEDHEQTFATAFIHGTCDAHLAYGEVVIEGSQGQCVAEFQNADTGAETVSVTRYGSYSISQKLKQIGAVYEMYTFCGAGHNSGNVWPEINNNLGVNFLHRSLCAGVDESMERAYKFSLENFSNQCCLAGDPPLPYWEHCDCDGPNPPIELDVYPNGDSDTLYCSEDIYCGPLSVGSTDAPSPFQLSVHPEGDRLIVNITAPRGEQGILRIYDVIGRQLVARELSFPMGSSTQTIPLPRSAQGVLICTIASASAKVVVHR